MTTDIFLRSYAADLPWVPYALRSLQKFVTGTRDVIISVPEEDIPAFKTLNLVKERLVKSMARLPHGQGYCEQQLDKLMADLYSDADHILFWDSDCIAIRPLHPDDLIVDGAPRCLITHYSKLVHPDGSPAVPWQPVAEKALGHPCEYEAMRQHPFLVPRRVLKEFREYMFSLHGIPLETYIAETKGSFSEFNCLHNFALSHTPLVFTWMNTDNGVPEPFVKQFWSYSGLREDERRQIEEILK